MRPTQQGGGVFAEMSGYRQGEAQARWPAVLRQAQRGMAEWLSQAGGEAGFRRQDYLNWLAGEAAVCRLCATGMDAVAGWHGSQPGLRATVQGWAAELRELARLAATDVRTLGGITSAPLPLLEEWRAFLEGASGSQRAGEALGAIALHTRLLPGDADAALAALIEKPVVWRASQYLARRQQREPGDMRAQRDSLLDAYSNAALTAGAQRAATWAHDAIASMHITAGG